MNLLCILILQFLLLVPKLLAQSSIEFIRSHAVTINEFERLPPEVIGVLEKFDILTLGEMHGTEQSPQIILGILHGFENKKLLLALEIPETEQKLLEQFAKSGNTDILKTSPFFTDHFQDGRRSLAIVNLLQKVRLMPQVSIFAFDPAKVSSSQDRDNKMALNIHSRILEYRPELTIILSGNLHSSKKPGLAWDENYKPMANELLKLLENQTLFSIKQRYMDGEAWVCMNQNLCGITTFKPYVSNYSEAFQGNSYFIRDESSYEGYDATFYMESLIPSLPFINSGY